MKHCTIFRGLDLNGLGEPSYEIRDDSAMQTITKVPAEAVYLMHREAARHVKAHLPSLIHHSREANRAIRIAARDAALSVLDAKFARFV